MRRFFALLVIAVAVPAAADVIATTSRGVVVAHDGVVELRSRGRQVWSAPGVDEPAKIVVSDGRVAILDTWANRVRVVSLHDGTGTTFTTGESPVAGVFAGNDLYLIARDASRVERIAGDGSRDSIGVAADPALIGSSAGHLYVYSRVDGVLQTIPFGKRLAIARQAPVPPHASDMEIDGRTAYLIYPREAKLVTVNLDKFEIAATVAVGGAPSDIAIARRGTALSAPLIAVADPAAKRVWMTEGAQSVGAAFGRGFLRGFLGLGLFRPRSADFPRGVDRVVAGDGVTVSFDTSSGTLYRMGRPKVSIVAEQIDPQGFAIAEGKVVFWRGGALHEHP
ncbi:MAG TPA: hypothetical protein VFM36_08120 [Thermoanaerobaculia bacterium]|nr:hypothetical protein [Thermoanaerobaculia bacterium]